MVSNSLFLSVLILFGGYFLDSIFEATSRCLFGKYGILLGLIERGPFMHMFNYVCMYVSILPSSEQIFVYFSSSFIAI